MSGPSPFGPNQSAPLTGIRLTDEETTTATTPTATVSSITDASHPHAASATSRLGDAPAASTPAAAAAAALPVGEVMAIVESGNDEDGLGYKGTVDGVSRITNSSSEPASMRSDPPALDPPAKAPPSGIQPNTAAMASQTTSPPGPQDEQSFLDVEQANDRQAAAATSARDMSTGGPPTGNSAGSTGNFPNDANAISGNVAPKAPPQQPQGLMGTHKKAIIAAVVGIAILVAVIVGAVCGSGNCGGGGGGGGETSSNAAGVVSA